MRLRWQRNIRDLDLRQAWLADWIIKKGGRITYLFVIVSSAPRAERIFARVSTLGIRLPVSMRERFAMFIPVSAERSRMVRPCCCRRVERISDRFSISIQFFELELNGPRIFIFFFLLLNREAKHCVQLFCAFIKPVCHKLVFCNFS